MATYVYETIPTDPNEKPRRFEVQQKMTDPPLTTVHQPVRGKGEAAVRLLLSVIEGRDQRPGHRRLETRLIVRGSTGPVPQGRQEVTAARPKSA